MSSIPYWDNFISGETRPFLAPSGAQEMQMSVRLFDESLSRALKLHLKAVWVNLFSVSGLEAL